MSRQDTSSKPEADREGRQDTSSIRAADREGRRRRIIQAALLLWGVFVCAATLLPAPPSPSVRQAHAPFDLRATADFVRNVALFVPLGLALAWLRPGSGTRRRVRVAALAGGALSLSIEAAQLGLAGRDPAWSDVLANTLGAMLGACVPAMLWSRFVGAHDSARVAVRGDVAGVATLWAVVALQLLALSPAAGQGPLFLHVKHRLEYIEPVRGRVDGLEVAGAARAPGWAPDLAPADVLRPGGPTLRLRYVPEAEAPDRLASILIVSDADLHTVVRLDQRDRELGMSVGTRGAALGFGSVQGVWPGVLDPSLGPLWVELSRAPRDGVCVRVVPQADPSRSHRRCDLSPGLADGWSLFSPRLIRPSPAARAASGLAWLGFGFALAGGWLGRSRRSRSLGVLAVGASLGLWIAAPMRDPGLVECAVCFGAFALGAWVGARGGARGA